MGQHGSECGVADTSDALDGGVVLRVDDDATLVIDLDADFVEVEAVCVRPASDGDEDDVGLEGVFLAALGCLGLDGDRSVVALHLGAEDFGVQFELEALFGEDLLERLGDLVVDALSADAAEELDDGDLGAEPAPDRAHLEADDAAADDGHPFWDLFEIECAGAADDALLVDGDGAAGEGSDVGAGCDDDVFTLDLCFAAVVELYGERCGGEEGRCALDVVDLVFLEEALDALCETGDRGCLCFEHCVEIDGYIAD